MREITSKDKGDTQVEERTVITALQEIARTLGALALVAASPDDPLALPEPPTPDEVAAYDAHITAMRAQVDASYHPLLAMSLRDYRAGYADRASAYLVEFVDKLKGEAGFTQRWSPESQRQLEICRAALQEL
jgi:hypothetical protein